MGSGLAVDGCTRVPVRMRSPKDERAYCRSCTADDRCWVYRVDLGRIWIGNWTIPAGILALGILFFPESPRHLVETDREDEALRVIQKLHYDGHNQEWIDREFNEIKMTIAAEKAITVPGWGIMFTVPQWRTRLMHGVAVQVSGYFIISDCLMVFV
jgi:hypothetical protein